MSKFWSKVVQTIEPYVPGEQPQDKKYIKLNTNECPYPPSPIVIEAIESEVGDRLRLYPDPHCSKLIHSVATYYKLNENQVFVGNGSDEILAFSFLAYFNPGDTILYPDITYSFYPVYSNLFGINYNLQPLTDGFDIELSDYNKKNDGIIIANPNAPTGKAMNLAEIRQILDNNRDSVVIVDEAYVDFGAECTICLINEYDNLLVVQTLSKSRSLAGMRIGFAMGNEALIDALNRVKNSINSYTLDRLAIVAGVAAMDDESYFQSITKKIIETRTWVTDRLRTLGFTVPESKANFVFAAPSTIDAKTLFVELKAAGILVRYFDKPRINGYLRISIGTDEEMTALCEAIEIIQNKAVD